MNNFAKSNLKNRPKACMKTKMSWCWLFCVLFSSSTVLGADKDSDVISGTDTLPGYLGVLAGGNIPSDSNAGATAAIGVTLGSRLGSLFGVGLFASYYGQTSTGPYLGLPPSTAMSVILATAQGNLHFGGFHFGAEVGAAIRSWSGVVSTLVGGTATSSTTLLIGIDAGYDYKISRNLSLGVEGHYFFPGAATEANASQVFAVLKLWL